MLNGYAFFVVVTKIMFDNLKKNKKQHRKPDYFLLHIQM